MLGPGMVVGVSWKAVPVKLLDDAPPQYILLTRSCPVAEMLLMSPHCGLQHVFLQELSVCLSAGAGCPEGRLPVCHLHSLVTLTVLFPHGKNVPSSLWLALQVVTPVVPP